MIMIVLFYNDTAEHYQIKQHCIDIIHVC
jgi:hypothetical protein